MLCPLNATDQDTFFLNKKNGMRNSGSERPNPHNAPPPNIPPMEANANCSLLMTCVLPSGMVQVISTV